MEARRPSWGIGGGDRRSCCVHGDVPRRPARRLLTTVAHNGAAVSMAMFLLSTVVDY